MLIAWLHALALTRSSVFSKADLVHDPDRQHSAEKGSASRERREFVVVVQPDPAKDHGDEHYGLEEISAADEQVWHVVGVVEMRFCGVEVSAK